MQARRKWAYVWMPMERKETSSKQGREIQKRTATRNANQAQNTQDAHMNPPEECANSTLEML